VIGDLFRALLFVVHQMSVRTVTRGTAAIRPPSLSLRLGATHYLLMIEVGSVRIPRGVDNKKPA
jgi:hypothetical protein